MIWFIASVAGVGILIYLAVLARKPKNYIQENRQLSMRERAEAAKKR